MPLPDFTYHPDRVIYPMKRAKEDLGKNEWERTTWEDAYNIIEENIGRIKKEHGPESIVVFGGTGREGGPMCGPYGIAMIDIIIQEDLYDHDFVDRFCYGFEQLAERVATMPAEKAAEICGLDVEFRERHRSMVGTHYGASPNMLGSVVDAVKVGETKGDLEIQYELGTRLNPGTYARFANFEEFRAEFRMGNCGMTYEELKEKVVYQREVNYRKYETGRLRPDGQPGFNTPTGASSCILRCSASSARIRCLIMKSRSSRLYQRLSLWTSTRSFSPQARAPTPTSTPRASRFLCFANSIPIRCLRFTRRTPPSSALQTASGSTSRTNSANAS